MRSDEAQPTQLPRRSCGYYGCLSVLVVVLAMTAWIGSGFVFWQQITIPLPDGSGSVVYMARLNKIPSAEWDRKIRIETSRFHGRMRLVPGDPSGAFPVNVYWYSAQGGRGPYLRFHDPEWEYLVDLKRGIAMLVYRLDDGSAYVGEILTQMPRTDRSEDPMTGRADVAVDGRAARRPEKRVASRRGTYLGRIDHPRYGFVSAEESPEEDLLER